MDNFKKQEITTIDGLALFYLRLTRYRAAKIKEKASRKRLHNYRKTYKKIRAIDHFYEILNIHPDKQFKSFKKLYKLGGKVRDIENETKLLYELGLPDKLLDKLRNKRDKKWKKKNKKLKKFLNTEMAQNYWSKEEFKQYRQQRPMLERSTLHHILSVELQNLKDLNKRDYFNDALHDTRKTWKKIFYALKFFGDQEKEIIKPLKKKVKKQEQALGDVHDRQVLYGSLPGKVIEKIPEDSEFKRKVKYTGDLHEQSIRLADDLKKIFTVKTSNPLVPYD